MAASHSLVAAPFLTLLLTLQLTCPTAARHVSLLPTATSSPSLASRLKLDTGDDQSTTNCWESLIELQACSGEIILFFLNGETYLGDGCCDAIRVIGEHCWPDLIETLGFTGEESDVLEGYCDRADDGDDGGDDEHHAPPPPAAVAHSPAAVHAQKKAN
ncbi:Egg cell-secreted protein 1.1 [Linum perenne]